MKKRYVLMAGASLMSALPMTAVSNALYYTKEDTLRDFNVEFRGTIDENDPNAHAKLAQSYAENLKAEFLKFKELSDKVFANGNEVSFSDTIKLQKVDDHRYKLLTKSDTLSRSDSKLEVNGVSLESFVNKANKTGYIGMLFDAGALIYSNVTNYEFDTHSILPLSDFKDEMSVDDIIKLVAEHEGNVAIFSDGFITPEMTTMSYDKDYSDILGSNRFLITSIANMTFDNITRNFYKKNIGNLRDIEGNHRKSVFNNLDFYYLKYVKPDVYKHVVRFVRESILKGSYYNRRTSLKSCIFTGNSAVLPLAEGSFNIYRIKNYDLYKSNPFDTTNKEKIADYSMKFQYEDVFSGGYNDYSIIDSSIPSHMIRKTRKSSYWQGPCKFDITEYINSLNDPTGTTYAIESTKFKPSDFKPMVFSPQESQIEAVGDVDDLLMAASITWDAARHYQTYPYLRTVDAYRTKTFTDDFFTTIVENIANRVVFNKGDVVDYKKFISEKDKNYNIIESVTPLTEISTASESETTPCRLKITFTNGDVQEIESHYKVIDPNKGTNEDTTTTYVKPSAPVTPSGGSSSSGVETAKVVESKPAIVASNPVDLSKKVLEDYSEVKSIFLVAKDKPVDALSIAPVATLHKSPILFIDGNKIDKALLETLKSRGVSNVYLVGGDKSISKEVESGFHGFSVKRIAGRDRYETNVESINMYPVNNTHKAYMTSGENFADALSLSPLAVKEGRYLLLTNKNSVPESIKEKIDDLKLNDIISVGGSESINPKIYHFSSNISGKDRYETSSLISANVRSSSYKTNGEDECSTLIGSVLAGKDGKSLLLDKYVNKNTIVR